MISTSTLDAHPIVGAMVVVIRRTDHGAVQDLVDGVTVLPLTPEFAALATSFPREFPRGPADRLITATARTHALPLVTADRAIRDSPLVETIW